MTDFIIIGGGVYGSATAFWLATQGAGVHLLEAKGIGNGASAGPGRRGTRANGRDLRELPLARLSLKQWQTLHETLGVPQFFERTGHLLLFEREQDLAHAEAIARLQMQFGVETRLLSASEVHDRQPGLSPAILGALHCPHDGASDHTTVTHAFADAARRAGATISEGAQVERIETKGGRAIAVMTSAGERFDVGRGLLVLPNAGAVGLLGKFITLPMWSQTFQVMLTDPVPDLHLTHLIGHMSRTLALKSEAGGRIMISGGLPGIWDAETETGMTIDASIRANHADAAAVCPALSDAGIELSDADHLETRTVDDIPVIDRVPGVDNAIYAAGWCGHGWAIAPAVTQMLADWAMSGKRHPLLAPFAQSRFKEA